MNPRAAKSGAVFLRAGDLTAVEKHDILTVLIQVVQIIQNLRLHRKRKEWMPDDQLELPRCQPDL